MKCDKCNGEKIIGRYDNIMSLRVCPECSGSGESKSGYNSEEFEMYFVPICIFVFIILLMI